MQKPSWCFAVNTMYSCPAARAKSMKVFGSNFDGLNRLGNSRYSASLMPPGVGVIMGQEASTLASEYGPQWMNMPNLASRYQRVRSLAKLETNPRLRINGSADPGSASLMKSRREGEQAFTRVKCYHDTCSHKNGRDLYAGRAMSGDPTHHAICARDNVANRFHSHWAVCIDSQALQHNFTIIISHRCEQATRAYNGRVLRYKMRILIPVCYRARVT